MLGGTLIPNSGVLTSSDSLGLNWEEMGLKAESFVLHQGTRDRDTARLT